MPHATYLESALQSVGISTGQPRFTIADYRKAFRMAENSKCSIKVLMAEAAMKSYRLGGNPKQLPECAT